MKIMYHLATLCIGWRKHFFGPVQGDRIGWWFSLGSFLKISGVAQIFGLLFSSEKVMSLFWRKMGWEIFSQSHPVTPAWLRADLVYSWLLKCTTQAIKPYFKSCLKNNHPVFSPIAEKRVQPEIKTPSWVHFACQPSWQLHGVLSGGLCTIKSCTYSFFNCDWKTWMLEELDSSLGHYSCHSPF
jgi:hypothetical protein